MLYTNIFQSQQFAPKRLVIITLRPCKNGNRYVICDTETEIVIENAQGHGFSSFEKAENFALSHGWLAINKPETPESTPLF